MSDRYAPVPYVAVAVVGDSGRLAVLDLYMRAHSADWRPLRTTDRELAVAWKVDRRQVPNLLAALEAAGLLRATLGDERWQGRTIVVREPGQDFAPATMASATAASTNAVPATVPAVVVPTSKSDLLCLVDTRASDRQDRTGQDRKKEKGDKSPGTPDEQACWDAYVLAWGGKHPTLPEWKGIKRALTKYRVPAVVVSRYIAWLATSQDPKPVYLREGGYARSETPWRENHFESYVELMQNPPGSQKGGSYQRREDDKLPPPAHPDDDLPF